MKMMRLILAVTAASAVVFTTSASEQPSFPKGTYQGPRVIEGTGVQNPNLLAGLPIGGSRALVSPSVVSTGAQDPDLLAAVKNCSMSPRTLDSAECKKMCAGGKK